MKVKDLIALLATVDPESDVLIADNGSIMNTGSVQETVDYNEDNNTDEYFIVTEEWQ